MSAACTGASSRFGAAAPDSLPHCGDGEGTAAASRIRALLAFLAVLAALSCAGLALAALTFPPLTGRVVDQANVLSAGEREKLTTQLAELEQKSGIQLVVATVNSLQDQDIEPY